jgi:hypothetical protein
VKPTSVIRCLTIMACAVMTTVASVGCESARVGGADTVSAPPTAPESTMSAPTSGPVTEPVPASAQPSAADGTNYQACLGGDCEITVSKPVTIKLSGSPVDAGPMTVKKVNAGSVVVGMALPAGPSLDTTIETGCTTAFSANNTSGAAITSCSREPADLPGMYVKQLVTVKAITGRTAILHLKSE